MPKRRLVETRWGGQRGEEGFNRVQERLPCFEEKSTSSEYVTGVARCQATERAQSVITLLTHAATCSARMHVRVGVQQFGP